MATRARVKTEETDADVATFLDAVEDQSRRKDAEALVALMRQITGEAPRMWGNSIVGFGRCHYRYASGHEGDSCLVGFSPRKAALSIYLTGTCLPEMGDSRAALLEKLGKHKIGKACLYINRLKDIDMPVLAELVQLSVEKLRQHHPAGG